MAGIGPINSKSSSDPQVVEQSRHTAGWTQLKKRILEYLVPNVAPNEGLRYWQEWILQSMLVLAVALGVIAIIPIVFLALPEGLWHLVLFNVSALVLGLCLIYARRLTYVKRVIGALIICYAMGVGLIFMLGLTGGGPYWLFSFVIMTALLLDLEAAIVALILNAITLMVAS